jgi:hypothetical protein
MELTDQEKSIIQMIVLDRWNPNRLTWKISNHFGLSENQARHIRRKTAFQAELRRQQAIYRGEFDGVQLADRKERVLALQTLYERVPDMRVALKLKILNQIRHEVGQDEPLVQSPEPGPVGLNIPPRASSFAEWVDQNRLADSV